MFKCFICKKEKDRKGIQMQHLRYRNVTEKDIVPFCIHCHLLWHFKFGFPLNKGWEYVKLFKKYMNGGKKTKKRIWKYWKKIPIELKNKYYMPKKERAVENSLTGERRSSSLN